jgi:hypothetical protein
MSMSPSLFVILKKRTLRKPQSGLASFLVSEYRWRSSAIKDLGQSCIVVCAVAARSLRHGSAPRPAS